MKKRLLLLFLLIILFSVPAHAAVWEQVPLRSETQARAGLKGGEGMQMVQAIAYAPNNPQVLYLGSDTSQVWKSTDGGKTWKMKHRGFYANGALSLGVDPLNEDIVFAAGSIGYPVERYQPTNPLCGIFRTRNGGDNWELVKETLYFKREDGDDGGTYFVFATDSGNTGMTRTIYAGTYRDGLLKSQDGGDTWSYCGLKDINIYDIKIHPNRSSAVFIAATQGLYKYYAKSGRIDKIGSGLPDYPRTIAVNPKNPDILYAAVGKYGVYCSGDGGINFIKKSKGLLEGKEYTHISLSPANPEYLYVSINKNGGHKLNPFYSHDGGSTWHAPGTLDQGGLALFAGEQRYFSARVEPHPFEPDIAFTSANGKARILKTADCGKNWSYSAEGYTGGRMGGGRTAAAFGGNLKKIILFLIDFGPALTEDGASTFKMLPVEKTFGHFTSNPVGAIGQEDTAKTIIAAVGRWDKQLLEVSRDNGSSWKIIYGTEDNYRFIAFHPQKPNIIYAQGLKSENGGISWKRLPQKIYAMFRGNGDIVYSVNMLEKNKSVIKRSNDGGKTWGAPYPLIPIAANMMNEIDIDPKNPDRIYIAANFGLGIYDNKTKRWIKKGEESGLSKDYFGLTAIKCIAVDPRRPEVIYAGRWAPGKGQSNGVFMSTDYGNTWKNITYNLDQPITIWSISVSLYDGTVYIGSSHGTWRLPPPY